MCGILGFYSNNKNEDINLLNNFKIAKEIGNHRGPDGYGIFKDEENQVF